MKLSGLIHQQQKIENSVRKYVALDLCDWIKVLVTLSRRLSCFSMLTLTLKLIIRRKMLNGKSERGKVVLHCKCSDNVQNMQKKTY